LCAHRNRDFRHAFLTMISVRDTPAGATFQVKVHPRAKKNAIVGEVGEALKLALTAPPVEGRANEACVAFFAEFLNVPRSSVTIAAGESSRNKVIRVSGMSAAQVAVKISGK
jgi:uncharacterized protein (TIGR00251 family)